MWNSVLQTNPTQLWRKQNVNDAQWFREAPPVNNPRAPHLADWRKILGIQGSGVWWSVACAPLVLVKPRSQGRQRPQGRWRPWSDPAWALGHGCPCCSAFSVLREPLSVRIGTLTPLSVGIWRWCHLLNQPSDWMPLVVCSRCLRYASTSHRQRSPSSCITHASSSRPVMLVSKASASSNVSPLLCLCMDTWVAGDSRNPWPLHMQSSV